MNRIHFDALDRATQLPSGTIQADFSTVTELIELGYATPRDPQDYSYRPQISRAGRIAYAEALTA